MSSCLCKGSCGNGTRTRQSLQDENFGGKLCEEVTSEPCKLEPCPIDCKWSDWSPCDASCGYGMKYRNIIEPAEYGGKECEGYEYKSCHLKPCDPGMYTRVRLFLNTCISSYIRNGEGHKGLGNELKIAEKKSKPSNCLLWKTHYTLIIPLINLLMSKKGYFLYTCFDQHTLSKNLLISLDQIDFENYNEKYNNIDLIKNVKCCETAL